jgi:hypothetical protein
LGQFYTQRKINKKNHATVQEYANKNSIHNAEHNAKHRKIYPRKHKYNRIGINRTKCLDCQLKCIEQTGRTFLTSYKERIKAIRNNSSYSEYTSHILNMEHTYGTITDTMDIIRTQKRKTLKHIRKITHI